MNIALSLFAIALAPLLQGAMKLLRARLAGRVGSPPWQPYRDLRKLFGKHAKTADQTSLLVDAAPGVVLGVALTFALVAPQLVTADQYWLGFGAVGVALVLALGRFTLVAAALDMRSGFEAMAAGREIAFAALTEAPLILALLGAAFPARPAIASVLGGAALLLVMLFETARVPVDNQETHYELTMVHEGLVLEYSGFQLALLELAAYIRQATFVLLLALMLPGGAWWTLAWIAVIAFTIIVIETTQAKMRLFEVPQLFSSALILAIASLGVQALGIFR